MPKAQVRTKLRTRKSAAKRVKRFTADGTAIARSKSNQHRTAFKSDRSLSLSGRSKRLGKQQSKNLRVLLPTA
jgi:ribosomal protein L35